MLRVLLVFVWINAVYSQEDLCPQYDSYPNNVGIMNNLNGTYYSIYTSTSPVADCQYVTYTVDTTGAITGVSGWPGCCMSIYDFDAKSDPSEVQYKMAPLSGECSVTAISDFTTKYLATVGSGDNLCLIYTSCRIGQVGVYVICRQSTAPRTLLAQVILALTNVLGPIIMALVGIPNLQPVNQSVQSCVFPPDNGCSPY